MADQLTNRIAEVLREEIRTALGLKSGDYFPSEVFDRGAEAVVAAMQLTPENRKLQNYPEGLDIEIRTQRGVGTAECNQCGVSEHGSYYRLTKWADNHARTEHGWQGPQSESRYVTPWVGVLGEEQQ